MAESQISQGIPLTIKTSNSKEYLSLDSNDAILEKHYELIRSLNFKAKKEAITRSQTINQASVSSSQDNTVIYDNHEKVSEWIKDITDPTTDIKLVDIRKSPLKSKLPSNVKQMNVYTTTLFQNLGPESIERIKNK